MTFNLTSGAQLRDLSWGADMISQQLLQIKSFGCVPCGSIKIFRKIGFKEFPKDSFTSFLLLIFFYSLCCTFERWRGWGWAWREIAHLLVYFPNAQKSQDWVRVKPGIRNSIRSLKLVAGIQLFGIITCYLEAKIGNRTGSQTRHSDKGVPSNVLTTMPNAHPRLLILQVPASRSLWKGPIQELKLEGGIWPWGHSVQQPSQ